MIQGLMDSIVRADDEVGSRRDKDIAGATEQLCDRFPVGLLQEAAVFSEAERVQDNFRMVMRTEDTAALSSDGFVAKCSSRPAAGGDAYGFHELPGVHE